MTDDWTVRRLIYTTLADTGRAPSPAELAAHAGIGDDQVRASLRRLHDGHMIVLGPYGDAVRMAHPFSAAPMGFVVAPAEPYDDRLWWGGCTWDSFGISAALKLDVVIDTRCPGCATALRYEVGPGRPPGEDWVAHIPRPARQWWDDVVDTCTHIRTFCSPDHLADWAGRTRRPIGQAVPVRALWALAQPWYGDRLDPGYRPRPIAASQRLLSEHGFDGDFWRLPA
ncbi:organomercurial lyase [Nonomuraea sp. NPDC003804]|uniref:organomercurial lyase n=1 Tax=Nonomuraea sp. NPDC003804 TaxID=3154547 RepID=UPI0033B894BE